MKQDDYRSLHTWCYGHTHFNNDQTLGRGVRLVCNQRGYRYTQEKNYRKDLVLTIPRGPTDTLQTLQTKPACCMQ